MSQSVASAFLGEIAKAYAYHGEHEALRMINNFMADVVAVTRGDDGKPSPGIAAVKLFIHDQLTK